MENKTESESHSHKSFWLIFSLGSKKKIDQNILMNLTSLNKLNRGTVSPDGQSGKIRQ